MPSTPCNPPVKFEQLLRAHDDKRPGYRASLGEGISPDILTSVFELTEYKLTLIEIYKLVKGTPAMIQTQRFMDFIPGYRLMQLSEVNSETRWNDEFIVPILTNYSSDYIGFLGGVDSLWRLNHDDFTAYKIYDNSSAFFETIFECLKFNAYFLDSDGYLVSDAQQVSEIATRINPDSNYWRET